MPQHTASKYISREAVLVSLRDCNDCCIDGVVCESVESHTTLVKVLKQLVTRELKHLGTQIPGAAAMRDIDVVEPGDIIGPWKKRQAQLSQKGCCDDAPVGAMTSICRNRNGELKASSPS